MNGDFSRLVLDPASYSRVLMQQGRVMVDSDWNDLVAILVASQRALAADLIGPHGGPKGNVGFAIEPLTVKDKRDLAIGNGVYYVDGIRCANDGSPGGGNDPRFRYSAQPYPPFDDEADLPSPPFLVYLDVWERHVSALQAPAIREVALGGPDTTSRAEVVWQVRTLALEDRTDVKDCKSFPLAAIRAELGGTDPLLKVRAKDAGDTSDDPCLSPPDARYRGPENQLYRVQVHAVDGDAATFVWSRENGSVVAEWLATDGDELRVGGVRDAVRGFRAGDWVELLDDQVEFRGEAGPLVRLARVDGDVLTVDRTSLESPLPAQPSLLPNARVRRWDQRERPGAPLTRGAVPVDTGTGDGSWIDLEDGIQVQFQPAATGSPSGFRVGDHWVFPARVATGDVIWPPEGAGDPLALPPHGVEHHYAPLALVSGGITGPSSMVDLRHHFTPLSACVKGT